MPDNTYETSDIYFAAYLYAIGYPMTGTRKFQDKGRGKEKTLFIFSVPDEEISTRKAEFFGNTGKVLALDYSNAFRSLKSLCFVN